MNHCDPQATYNELSDVNTKLTAANKDLDRLRAEVEAASKPRLRAIKAESRRLHAQLVALHARLVALHARLQAFQGVN